MDWESVLINFLGALCGSAIPVICFAFWLGGVSEKVRALCERCTKREVDHCHHYDSLSKHEVKLTNLDTRVVSLEQWRDREQR